MKAATLRDELVAGCLGLAWDQWSQVGVSGVAPSRREERAADPEALLLFTLQIARHDPRLFDEVLDWLALNLQHVSVQRLRNLAKGEAGTLLVDAALAWATPNGRSRLGDGGDAETPLEPLFPTLVTPDDDLDQVFARCGFARRPLRASGKSQAPRLTDPIGFMFRLRRLLGVGVRAEVVGTLLTTRAHRLSGRTITASAAYAQRNVREGLTHLVEAGVLRVVQIADDRQYAIDLASWAALLGLPRTLDMPLHFDWIASLRALARIVRWLHQPGIDDLSEYLLASQARTLVDELSTDLQLAGVPIALYPALGPDYWNTFCEISRAALRNARHSEPDITGAPTRDVTNGATR